jgi:mannose-1-phosphate guanylyltransferase / mannose-6-phosphate isomerase
MHISAVIMCGGSGTRLWPLSRRDLPKQFAIAREGKTLFERTYERAHSVVSPGGQTICIGHCDYRFLIRDGMQNSAGHDLLLLEPVSRNTAAAIASAALYVARTSPQGILVCMPADHEIASLEVFGSSVNEAARIASEGWIAVLGITPSFAATTYGYIRPGKKISETAWAVAKFIEKPHEAAAREYVQKGYKWNSGLVVARADVLIAALTSHAPDIITACRQALERSHEVGGDILLNEQALDTCPSISFDYAVLEPHDRVAVVNFDAEWSDVGSWTELAKLFPADGSSNRSLGQAEIRSSENTFTYSPERLTVALGLSDVIIADTADALLVAHTSKLGELRQVVSDLMKAKRQEVINHRKDKRPWGSFISVDRGEQHQVKRITVKPGGVLSLQYHHHRAEHWVVVRGTARVTCGEREFDLKQNESTFIPQGAVHRLENRGTEDLEIIEVQCGSYLGEDDIVRLSDSYGRITPTDSPS